jgi:hypothetical protein
MAPTPGDLPTSSRNARAPSHALRRGNTPSQFLPPAPTMRSPAPLRCVGCSASFPTLQALCSHRNTPLQRALSRPTIAQLWMPIATFSRCALFANDTFGAVALVDANILLTAIPRPPNRRHAVLRFRADGRPRCIPSPCPPPSNGALTMGPLVGRTPKPSSSFTSVPSDLVRPRTASPLRRYASSSRPSRSLSVAFCLSAIGPPKGLPRKRFGRRCLYFRA